MANLDIEKQNATFEIEEPVSTGSVEIQEKTGVKGFWNEWINKLNAETRGIERVPEEEQIDDSAWNAGSIWFGCNMVVATFAIGVLGVTIFDLGFWPGFLVIVFFNLIGSQSVAYFSTFGPISGLRQMVVSRYWFGSVGVKFCSFFNVIACIGWAAVNVIVSAQLLHSVNNGALPSWAGIIILTFLTLIVTFFGYKVVHLFEKWSWVPTVIIFLIIAIRMGKTGAFTYGTMGTGPTEAGNILSFSATVYGYATGWTSMASDYTVYMKKQTSRPRIFIAVIAGLNIPLIIAMTLGLACATGCLTSETFATNYANNSVGGLFFSILVDDSLHGFGQFCIVVLALSTISNNTPNLYSFGLSIQSFWSKFRYVPRIAWTFIAAGVSMGIAIPGYMHFETVIHNFMNLIGYWIAIYTAIGLSEHFIWRKGFKGYDFEAYDNYDILPIGIAAILGFLSGIGGAIIGMNQVWWQGPAARAIGDFGGDIAPELAFVFAAVVFNIARYFEFKYIGR